MKRILQVVIVVALVVSCGIFISRLQVEMVNQHVEIVYDLPGLKELSQNTGLPLEKLLKDLKEQGVQTIAVQPLTLGEGIVAGYPVQEDVLSKLPTASPELAKYLPLPIAFEKEDFIAVTAAGLQVAPKLAPTPWELEAPWLSFNPPYLILSGQGEFPLEALQGYRGQLALVEFSTPQVNFVGTKDLVRLHGISAPEMAISSPERILNRYQRAVRERNIRVLYVRPFIEGEQSWERSLDLLTELQTRLVKGGFTLGRAQAFSPWKPATIWLIVVACGIWASALYYGQGVFPQFSLLLGLGALIGFGGTVVLFLKNFTLAQQSLALLVAIVFPALALQRGKNYWQIAGISLCGALFIVASLSGTNYLIKTLDFRGVKVAHLIPIILVAYTVVRPLKAWLNKDVPVRYLIWAGVAGLFGVVYILRTGNFGFPVAQWEIAAREFLENVLHARPRTKEILLGHPALYLALKDPKGAKSWWLIVAVIGQISLINTFTHTHTFLLISLLRTFYGLIIGYALGWLIFKLIGLGRSWYESWQQGEIAK